MLDFRQRSPGRSETSLHVTGGVVTVSLRSLSWEVTSRVGDGRRGVLVCVGFRYPTLTKSWCSLTAGHRTVQSQVGRGPARHAPPGAREPSDTCGMDLGNECAASVQARPVGLRPAELDRVRLSEKHFDEP